MALCHLPPSHGPFSPAVIPEETLTTCRATHSPFPAWTHTELIGSGRNWPGDTLRAREQPQTRGHPQARGHPWGHGTPLGPGNSLRLGDSLRPGDSLGTRGQPRARGHPQGQGAPMGPGDTSGQGLSGPWSEARSEMPRPVVPAWARAVLSPVACPGSFGVPAKGVWSFNVCAPPY